MANNRKLSVFLCHSSNDKELVRTLHKQLSNDGYEPWFDEDKLLPGQDWDLEIRKAISGADAVIVCLSKNSVTKEGYVQKEIKLAVDMAGEKPEGVIFLIPVRLNECVVPDSLAKTQWVDLFNKGGYQKLLKSLYHRASNLGIQVKKDNETKIETSLPDSEKERELRLAYDQAKQIKEFDLRLRRAMPRSGGYAQAKTKTDINRVMKEIGRECEKYSLWWNSEYQHHTAEPIKYYPDNDVWVFDGNETKIIDLWVHKHPTLERQYVIIQVEANLPFGIYDPPGREVEEAAIFQGRYITYNEFYDGYTLVNGETVEVTDAEYRCRYLTPKFFIFAPHLSVYIYSWEHGQENDRIKNVVHENLLAEGRITVELLRPLEKLKRDAWMSYLD